MGAERPGIEGTEQSFAFGCGKNDVLGIARIGGRVEAVGLLPPTSHDYLAEDA
jgi:hypothetical protein